MSHPYATLPTYTRWSRSVAGVDPAAVDPVVDFPFRIAPNDRVATAGSCFAQHIARHLKKNGFNYYVVEDGHPIATQEMRDRYNYGVFSARYGNIYTSRQLVQLFQRANGEYEAKTDFWRSPKVAGFIDPQRPTIQPDGFSSREELRADRAQHLRLVREMFETLDVFVFTLGLTEMWFDRADGMALPVCPGVSGGEYDAATTGFRNLSASEIVNDMVEVFERLFAMNGKAKAILTVSPVPLAATALPRHVLTSTTYSKAVLRVAAEEICARFPNVAYFPSYEIVTGAFSRGRYFADDLRSVTEEGVEHVMRLVLAHATEMGAGTPAAAPPPKQEDVQAAHAREMANVVQALCDEEMIERSMAEAER